MASKCSQSSSASGSAAAAPPEGADDPAVPSSAPPGDAADYDSSDDSDYVYLPKGRDYILGREDASDEEFELDAPEPPAFEWRAEDNVPRRFAFSACPGVNATHLHRRSTPFQIYSHFVTPELMDHLVRETNRYYRQCHPSPAASDWHDTAREELYAYVGLQLLISMQRSLSMDIDNFFDFQDPLFEPSTFSETMPLERFLLLTENLHAVDNNATHSVHDRLWKLRPVVDALGRQFSSVYTPPQGLTVDECLWRFRRDGEVFGVKAYRLCVRDGAAPGYTSALAIYAGESEGDVPARGRVVVDLMAAAGLFGKGYELFTDSWYTSPALFRFLQGRQTNAVGTVRSRRKHMPTDLKKTRDEVVFRSTPTGILCLRWLRDGCVTMLSTVHDSEVVDDKARPGSTVPRVVSDSRAARKRARQHDPLDPPTPAVPDAIGWYKRVLFYLLQVAAANAFFVHGALGGKMTRWRFSRQLVVELIRGFTGKEPPPAGQSREPSL